MLFNFAIGNEDAHLKNWSLIYPDRKNPRLAPLYDVVSTVVLPGFTRESALKLGGKRKPQSILDQTMLRLVEKCGLPKSEGRTNLDAFFDLLRAAEPGIREESWPTKEEWSSLDEYRASVPLLTPLLT